MNDSEQPLVANIRVNVVVYKPKENNEFDFAMIEKASFSTQLSSADNHECYKEVQKLLTKTKKVWPELQEQQTP
tara:strand:+ start:71 stop:292 length:222 start_codon:yes stop_codon:yes gene_type:complete